MTRLTRLLLLPGLAGLALGLACSSPPPQDYPRQPAVFYEWLWADPTILISDTLHTIMYAQRIDSFKVDQNDGYQAVDEKGLRFRVFPEPCIVSIYLENPFGHRIIDLFRGEMPPGYYNVNIQPRMINDPLRKFPSYKLVAETCDNLVSRSVVP